MEPEEVRRAMNVSDIELNRVLAEFVERRFVFDKRDVVISHKNDTERRPRFRKKFNRRLNTLSPNPDVRFPQLFLTHRPTGVRVGAYIPPGNYSKKKLREIRASSGEKTLTFLNLMVLRFLRVEVKKYLKAIT